MKTKFLLPVIVLFSFLGNAFSQEYHPLLNNSSWVLSAGGSCCVPPVVHFINEGTDAVIGQYTYKKFFDPFPGHDSNFNSIDTVYIREDVAARKVYKIVNGSDALLYDFNLELDDTITQYGYTWTVTEVEQVSCNAGLRKKLKLQTYSDYYHRTFTMRWIEGVGSNAHPFYPERNIYSVLSAGGGYNYYTNCSFQDGLQVYGDPEYCGSMAAPLSTETNTAPNRQIAFSPNPLVTSFNIDSGYTLQNANLKLYDTRGQFVREFTNLSGRKITLNRENLSSGLYFAQLFENGQVVKTAKLIVD